MAFVTQFEMIWALSLGTSLGMALRAFRAILETGETFLTQLLQLGFRFSYGAFRLQARICPAGIVM